MAIHYTDCLKDVTADQLRGFFEGWRSPPSPERHLQILRGNRHVVLAMDDATGNVIGVITALADGLHWAFIPLLEVLPAYRHKGIGTQLVRRMLDCLSAYPCIDLTCDPGVQPFYEKCGMLRSTGMVVRDYGRSGPSGR